MPPPPGESIELGKALGEIKKSQDVMIQKYTEMSSAQQDVIKKVNNVKEAEAKNQLVSAFKDAMA